MPNPASCDYLQLVRLPRKDFPEGMGTTLVILIFLILIFFIWHHLLLCDIFSDFLI